MDTYINIKRRAVLERYQHLRSTMRALHNELMHVLTKDTFRGCARKLGFMVDDTVVIENEEESAALMDYCLYEGRKGQHNAISKLITKNLYNLGSDEMMLLNAMSHARYSLFQVESTDAGMGALCRNVLRSDQVFIVDEGLSISASPGVPFVCHLIVLPDMNITSGAVLPLDVDAFEECLCFLEDDIGNANQEHFDNLNHQEQADLSATLIQFALLTGASSLIQMLESQSRESRRQPERRIESRISRNDRCDCGSGKKYKRCCGSVNLKFPG